MIFIFIYLDIILIVKRVFKHIISIFIVFWVCAWVLLSCFTSWFWPLFRHGFVYNLITFLSHTRRIFTLFRNYVILIKSFLFTISSSSFSFIFVTFLTLQRSLFIRLFLIIRDCIKLFFNSLIKHISITCEDINRWNRWIINIYFLFLVISFNYYLLFLLGIFCRGKRRVFRVGCIIHVFKILLIIKVHHFTNLFVNRMFNILIFWPLHFSFFNWRIINRLI